MGVPGATGRIEGAVLPGITRLAPAPPPPLLEPHGRVTELVSSYSYKLNGASRAIAAASATTARPRVLFVTPFCVFPPRHGGARRIDGLLRELRRDFEIVLVTDE